MINLDVMPCSNCKNYIKIKRSGKEETSEFIKCKAADNEDAKNLLRTKNSKLVCDKQDKKF